MLTDKGGQPGTEEWSGAEAILHLDRIAPAGASRHFAPRQFGSRVQRHLVQSRQPAAGVGRGSGAPGNGKGDRPSDRAFLTLDQQRSALT
ncbi:hypothetical protein F2981_26115 (plasmid) [Sinorhizobium meliloti]|nr:hypothetical protein [Sinorhizobium meliloti]